MKTKNILFLCLNFLALWGLCSCSATNNSIKNSNYSSATKTQEMTLDLGKANHIDYVIHNYNNHKIKTTPIKQSINPAQIKQQAKKDIRFQPILNRPIRIPIEETIISTHKNPDEKRLEERFKGAEPYWGKNNAPASIIPIPAIRK
jgi:hypothetical protein